MPENSKYSDLDPYQFRVYAHIALSDPGDWQESNVVKAEKCQMSERKFYQCLKELKDMGLIKKKEDGYRLADIEDESRLKIGLNQESVILGRANKIIDTARSMSNSLQDILLIDCLDEIVFCSEQIKKWLKDE